MTELLLDSSFLLELVSKPMPNFQEELDRLGKVEIIILDSTLGEISCLRKRSGKKAKAASAALIYASKIKIKKTSSKGCVDDTLFTYAVEHKCAVATLDQELQSKLRRAGITLVLLRRWRVMVEKNFPSFTILQTE
jgi:rRNA-processing protein FCF1